MLKSYEMFFKSINESVVFYSDAFRNILKNINDPVSSALLDMESKDLDVARNYIDVSDTKDKITFIPDDRAKKIQEEKIYMYVNGETTGFLLNSPKNKQIFDELGFVPTGERQYRPLHGEEGKIIKSTTRPSGNTYCYVKFEGGESVINKKNLQEMMSDGVDLFTSSGRQSGKVGSSIKTFLSSVGKNFTDREIELFGNSYKSEFEKANNIFSQFELVEGKDIGYWYHYSKYDKVMGTLGSSCMREHDQDFFNFYNNNPEKVKLLILKNSTGDKIKGRALVWFLDKPKGVVFVDRVYYIEDSDADLFRKYAIEKGWVQKLNNSSTEDARSMGKDGVVDLGAISVNLKKESENYHSYEYTRYPYMDTLKYYDTYDGELTNDESGGGGYLTLEDVDGGVDVCDDCGGSGEVNCYSCNGRGDFTCEECDGSGEVECDSCDGSGKEKCSDCNGTGEIDGETCEECDGSGKDDCEECEGRGEVECDDCSGEGWNNCDDCEGTGTVTCGCESDWY